MRRLVPDNPAVHEPGLALALSNLGNFLSDLGRWPEALVAVAKAVEIYRRRAADRPTVLRPQLAMALHNLANHWSDAGDQDTALARMEAAVEIRRELAAELPAVHEQDYAVSLFNLGVRLRGAGRPVDGVRAVEQALEIYRRPRPGTTGRADVHWHSCTWRARCRRSAGARRRAPRRRRPPGSTGPWPRPPPPSRTNTPDCWPLWRTCAGRRARTRNGSPPPRSRCGSIAVWWTNGPGCSRTGSPWRSAVWARS
ncbi:tetratricopeptide repeat protein [Kitasatospora aburaviensis]